MGVFKKWTEICLRNFILYKNIHHSSVALIQTRKQSGTKTVQHTFFRLKPDSHSTTCPFSVATTCLSGPVADDEGRHCQANDQVDVHDDLQTGLFLQEMGRGFRFRRRRWCVLFLPLPLHSTQPAEGRQEPGLGPDGGYGG